MAELDPTDVVQVGLDPQPQQRTKQSAAAGALSQDFSCHRCAYAGGVRFVHADTEQLLSEVVGEEGAHRRDITKAFALLQAKEQAQKTMAAAPCPRCRHRSWRAVFALGLSNNVFSAGGLVAGAGIAGVLHAPLGPVSFGLVVPIALGVVMVGGIKVADRRKDALIFD